MGLSLAPVGSVLILDSVRIELNVGQLVDSGELENKLLMLEKPSKVVI